MPMSRTLALSLATGTLALALATPATRAQQAGDQPGDAGRGKIVFRSVGGCVNCHGWPADGKTGVDLRAPTGSNLRETGLDREGLVEVIRCGRPGTAMPYHARAAYRDGGCHGLSISDFAPGSEPARGKTFGEKDVANVVAYLQASVIGRGDPTHEECVEFFDNPAAKACDTLK